MSFAAEAVRAIAATVQNPAVEGWDADELIYLARTEGAPWGELTDAEQAAIRCADALDLVLYDADDLDAAAHARLVVALAVLGAELTDRRGPLAVRRSTDTTGGQ